MSSDLIQNTVGRCVRGQTPFCGGACPFEMDLRDLAKKAARGSFDAVYRIYAGAVLFPGVVSTLCSQPCKRACARASIDAAVELREVERAAVRLARRKTPAAYNIPAKEKTVAVVGAGLCGLACALRLAQKKYHATLFEREDTAGGRLRDQMAEEVFLPELRAAFGQEPCEWKPGCRITRLEEFAGFDAVLLATGDGGERFGIPPKEWNDGAPVCGMTGIFAAPKGDGDENPVLAIARGLEAARRVESYLKTGRVEEAHAPAVCADAQIVEPKRVAKSAPVAAENAADGYTREEAMREAARCLQCDCRRCTGRCTLMEHFGKTPLQLKEDVMATLNPVSSEAERMAMRLIATCNQCGLCADKCHAGADVGELLLNARIALHKTGDFPPPFHDFWMRDMRFSDTEAAGEIIPKDCTLLFFPGCQLGGSSPKAVTNAYETLRAKEPRAGLLLGCCGIPALWAGERDTFDAHTAALRETLARAGNPVVIFACPTCRRTFAEHFPEIKTRSLYEWMEEQKIPLFPPEGEAAVFDPCSSRRDPASQRAVRALLTAAGARLTELETAGDEAVCCGWGGQIAQAEREYAESVTKKRADMSQLPYFTYCANCRDEFAKQGKPCLHILDLLKPGADPRRAAPTVSERRENRRALLREVQARWLGQQTKPAAEPFRLEIPPALLEDMNRRMILVEDVRAVVADCERTQNKLQDADTGEFIGHRTIGSLTYWAVYAKTADGFALCSAYSHRMQIEEET